MDLWRQAKTEEETEAECEFLQEIFDPGECVHLLDVPCGNGRLALPMVRGGYKVTGIDFSDDFIEEAAKAAKDAGFSEDSIQFQQGDMRKISSKRKFDGAFCFGNSFGYFDRAGTNEMLASLEKSLKPGSKFVLESIMLAETFLVNGAEREWLRVGDMLMLIENQYDARESCVQTTYTFIRNGKEEVHHAVHWIYTTGELCSMLKTAGFSVIDIFGSLDCDPYELGSDKMILIAEKAR